MSILQNYAFGIIFASLLYFSSTLPILRLSTKHRNHLVLSSPAQCAGQSVNELEKLGDSLVSRFALCSCKSKKYSQFISLFSQRNVRNDQKLVWILLTWLPVLPPGIWPRPELYFMLWHFYNCVTFNLLYTDTKQIYTIYIGIFTEHLHGLQLHGKKKQNI